jgi:iron complex outermembrane receptor protein
VNFYNTDGYLQNVYLNRKADPDRDYAGRLRLVWKPSDVFSADLRFMYDRTETTAYYFVIPRHTEANPFSELINTNADANDVTSPIQNNNLGSDDRDILDSALKLDYSLGYGTLTLITDYNHTKEIDTGDAYDFRPVTTSLVYAATGTVPAFLGGPFDESQSQFIDVKSWSQELRFTAPSVGGFSWIAGAYFVHTKRFISTGNLIDRGVGSVPAVYYAPIVDPANPLATNTSATFLADGQDNNAYAIFGDGTWDFTKEWELDVALRYDQDDRQNTTLTPKSFLPPPAPGGPAAVTGEVRDAVFHAWQPKATLRYKPADDWTLYGGWSRGFRSGGFNQTGVGAVALANGLLGVSDIFKAEVAETFEVGAKAELLDRRLTLDADVYHTRSKNGYFFVYIAADSTQNLGNLSATYKGAELSLTYHPTHQLDFYVGGGYTDSRITAMADPSVIGNEAPLVSRNTFNAGVQYRQPVGGGVEGTLRLDYQEIGRTWWDPYNVTSRDPVNLVDLRLGLKGDKWSATLWSKNLTNTLYNAEFSPGAAGPVQAGGFLWRALPRRYGVDFDYRF